MLVEIQAEKLSGFNLDLSRKYWEHDPSMLDYVNRRLTQQHNMFEPTKLKRKITMTLEELLKKCEELPKVSFYFTMALLEELISSEFSYRVDNSKIVNRLSVKELYRDTDLEEKYGTVFNLLFLDDKPVLFFSRFGKWLDNYRLIHISDDLTKEVKEFILSTIELEDYDFSDYISDELTKDLVSSYCLNHPKFPVVKRDGVILNG